jgi:hypothetical protein
MDIEHTELMRYLHKLDSQYYGKVLELRETIRGWLEYVPNTFPHYTSHTIGHSEQIVLQLSQVLFHEHSEPTVNLSATETYILIAAAHLHDAGMVVSESEKQAILQEGEWINWTTGDGAAAERWRQIETFRAAALPEQSDSKVSAPEIRNFLADVQTRHLVAEYVRRIHHERAADIIRQHQGMLGRFAFDDPVLQRTIADICVAHGLPRESLDDRLRFPGLRQIRGDNCNIRLLAILLRIGDLLDLSTNRACPILLSAASPLPPESYAHWTQYNRITHFAFSPQSIVIRAECETPEEHRVLRDWCQWIEDEIRDAPKLLAGSERHHWSPPIARMDGDSPTITIIPSSNAAYRACDWRFELNEAAIFKRLIADVYESPLSFIRELMQNALDATRCQMYEELRVEGAALPASPTDVPEAVRERFPLRIRLSEEEVLNDRTGERERRQSVIFEDTGIGMDEEIIKHHFLQVGRSYYTTPEFRRRYSFTPTSRFGVGFLSVFNVSSHITVETFKASSPKPIRLTLTGPRNYLIVEEANRRAGGTKIAVRLNSDVNLLSGQLASELRDLCRRVEFPIFVDESGQTTEIRAEKLSDFTFDTLDVEREGGRFVMRAFPFKDDSVQGEIYVLARRDTGGVEDWASRGWYEYRYPKIHPEADTRPLVENLVCLHGILLNSPYHEGNCAARLDVRGQFPRLRLSREHHAYHNPFESRVQQRMRELLNEHLGKSELALGQNGWAYLNRLADEFPDMEFWAKRQQMIPLYKLGARVLASFQDVESEPTLTEAVTAQARRVRYLMKEPSLDLAALTPISIALVDADFRRLYDGFVENLFKGRVPTSCKWIDNVYLAIEWRADQASEKRDENRKQLLSCKIEDRTIAAICPDRPIKGGQIVLVNPDNVFGSWYLRARIVLSEGNETDRQRLKALSDVIFEAAQFGSDEGIETLRKHLTGWTSIPRLSTELKPPEMDIAAGMFARTPS